MIGSIIVIVITIANWYGADLLRQVVQARASFGVRWLAFFPLAFHYLSTSKMQEADVFKYVVFKENGNEKLYLLCVQF